MSAPGAAGLRVLLLAPRGPGRDARESALAACGLCIAAADDLAVAAAGLLRGEHEVILCEAALLDGGGMTPARLSEASGAVVVVLHAAGDEGAPARAIEAGACDAVGDDASPAELLTVVVFAARHRALCLAEAREEERERSRVAALEARLAELEARCEELDRETEPERRLSHLVVHDLKNQIAVVRSNIAYVLEETPEGEPRAMLEEAVRAFEPVLPRALDLVEAQKASPEDGRS